MALRVLFHKVGAGHAVHVFTPNGKLIVIDLGCSSDFSPLAWLKESGRTVIDYLVVTHPHGDHIDEMLLLKDRGFSVGLFSRPKWLTSEEVYAANQGNYAEHVDRYLEMSSRYSVKPAPSEQVTEKSENLGGVDLRIYSSQECGRSQINNHSLVVVLRYEQFTIVIPGDNESPSWQSLLKVPQFVADIKDVDLFLTSHHGRESGYCSDVFAENRKPRLFVVSDGCVKDTDATGSYSQQAREAGWKVFNRRGGFEEGRKVVTTRTDGFIDVEFGPPAAGASRYMKVSVA